MATREASHAGSWYSSNRARLSKELDGFLDAAGSHGSTPRALIVPHAGYSYSGPAAAWGYKNVDAGAGIRRVFLLGPSHHVFLRQCALSKCAAYATPLGDLAVDRGVYEELRATGHFVDMDVDVDEAGTRSTPPAVHLQVLRGATREGSTTLVPIMVEALSTNAEATYGEILAPYLGATPTCSRCRASATGATIRVPAVGRGQEDVGLHEQIEEMDRRGMEIAENKDADALADTEGRKHHMRPAPDRRAAPDAEKERRVRQDEGNIHQIRAEQRGDGLERQQRVVRVRSGVSRRVSVGCGGK